MAMRNTVVKYIKKGQNSYNFALTQDNIVNKKSEYSSTYPLNATLYDGTQKVDINDYQIEYSSLPEGVSMRIVPVNPTTVGIDVTIEAQAVVNSTITLNAVYKDVGVILSKTLSITTVEGGAKGERGATLRGPQDWNELGVGYQFYSGDEGETYLDVVVYENNYYLCKKSHVKTEDNFPTSTVDDNKQYWQLGDKIDLVATKVLLSEYAVIKNLGAEGITMKDNEGNVVFKAEKGNVTCKTGTFENVSVNGIIHSSLTYSSVKRIVDLSSYTIDPQKEAFNTLFVSTGSTCRVYLPDANAYEGLELNIYQNVVSTMELGSVIMSTYNQSQRIYCSNGTALINGTVVMTINSFPMGDNNFKIIPNILTRLLAVNGNWYVLSGALTGE